MRSFEVEDVDARGFVARVEAEVRDRSLDDVVSVRLDGDRLIVRFRYLGTSELTYRLMPRERGFAAELEDQRVASLHVPFRAPFEDRFDTVLDTVGARRT